MYRIKEKYKALIVKYAWTGLDTNSIYSKEVWINAGFKEYVLELID
jgi:hypothetical protein